MVDPNEQGKRERRDEARAVALKVPKTRAQKKLQEGEGATAEVSHQATGAAGIKKVLQSKLLLS